MRGDKKQQIGHVTLLNQYRHSDNSDLYFMATCRGQRDDEELYLVLTLNDGTVTPILGVPRALIRWDTPTVSLQANGRIKNKDVRKIELWSRPLKTITFAPAATQRANEANATQPRT